MNIHYTLTFPEPHSHYAEISIHISGINTNHLVLKMPVWTPGSYLIREFQKNIDFVEWSAIENSRATDFKRANKTDKNSWQIDVPGISELTVKYNTYCFEYSVRTNFVDNNHAFINGAATFLYVEGSEELPIEVHIQPFDSWKNISTSLAEKNNDKWIRTAENLDELIDSPIEIGNHLSYYFEAAGVSHELAIYGKSNSDTEQLIADLKKIIEVETSIFGSHPCSSYIFFIHNTDDSFGGLEHKHSSVNHIKRWDYTTDYQKAISLLAHEYFHLWNVKRIRPCTLGPFDYNAENYTELLWFFEGVTSYYDDYVCYRAGVTTKQDYLEIVAKNINEVLNTPGLDTQTLAEASYDTWLKYYRRNENSRNSQINYYTKGALVALAFDLLLLYTTNGAKRLDDVLKTLYDNYLIHPKKGITEEELTAVFNTVSRIDFRPYFEKYIHTTETPDLKHYFSLIGIHLKDETDHEKLFLGLSTKWKEGKLVITALNKNYGAHQSGLNVEDEIIAINGFRVFKDFTQIYKHKTSGDTIEVLLSRKGEITTQTVKLTSDNRKSFKLEQIENNSHEKNVLQHIWLNEKP